MRKKFVLFTLLFLSFINGLEHSVVLGSLSLISDYFHVPNKIGWFSVAFTMATIVVSPIIGYLSNAKPLKPLFRMGLACSVIGFLLCSIASDFSVLLIGRTIAGIGGGFLGVLTSAFIGRTFSLHERTKFDLISFILYSTGSFVGPVIGSLLTIAFGWRSIFIISFVLFVCLTVLVECSVKNESETSIGEKKSDPWFILQSVSFSVFLFALLLAIEGSQFVWVCLVFSLASIFIFVMAKKRTDAQLFPVPMIKSKLFLILISFSFIFGFTKFILLNYISIYVVNVLSFNLLVANFCLTMILIGNAVGNMVVTRLITRLSYKKLLLFAYIMEHICFLGLLLFTNQSVWLLYALIFMFGFANGFAGYPILLILQYKHPQYMGSAASMNNMARHFGGIFGVILFQHFVIQQYGVSAQSFTTGFALVWGVFALIGFAVLFLPSERLRDKS